MKRVALILWCASLALPAVLQSESLHLKDGSVLKGRVVKMESDTVYFETTFGSMIRVHKGKVVRIDIDDSGVDSSGRPLIGPSVNPSAARGTLSVSFEEFELTSRIIVKRGGDREAYENENAIEEALTADGKKVYSYVDSVTDKTVRSGPETMLRNDIKPRSIEVALEPGFYRCVLAVGNTRASALVERFDPAPLDKKLVLDTVRVEPGETTHVRVGMRRKSWRSGKTELFKID